MKIIETNLKGSFLIEPVIIKDNRGIFFESFRKDKLETAIGHNLDFVQDNHSISKKGVLRGLHFQTGEAAQAKLVRTLKGEVLDVIVDIRPNSKTFGKYFKTKLSSKNKKILYIPRGMAHGFLALSNEVIFEYKCDNYYNPDAEGGIIYNDPELGINWEFPSDALILSSKDLKLPKLKEHKL